MGLRSKGRALLRATTNVDSNTNNSTTTTTTTTNDNHDNNNTNIRTPLCLERAAIEHSRYAVMIYTIILFQ